jgi:excisionase family DNA binding protein
MDDAEPLYTTAEVAAFMRVDRGTVVRWAKAGDLRSIRTPGGHRRFRESDVGALLAPPPAGNGIPEDNERTIRP